LLGRTEISLPGSPTQETLEIFDNPNPKRDYWIELDCPEFSSLCPVTGQPDTAHVSIRYVPGKHCVETKSLKFYLASYRNQPSFNEAVINRIADDLIAVCDPRHLSITGAFSSRGGISLTVQIDHPED
ncbi:MAG: preQ(1) synthase, partial [Verrucomicrobiales bacterium]